MISTLDEDFSKLSLIPPSELKLSHPLSPGCGPRPKIDEDLHRMTMSDHSTSARVSDNILAYMVIEIFRSLKPLSIKALTSRAIIQDLSEDNPYRIDDLIVSGG